jgi:hypothetical protein
MNVEKAPFLTAAENTGISPEKAAALWEALAASPAPAGSFSVANVAYYFGGLVVIGAMTFFMTEGWANIGAGFVCVTALIYGIVLAAAGWMLYRREATRTPGGILVTAAVCMTPLAIYGFQAWNHLWLDGDPGKYDAFYYLVHGSWIWMEIGTILVAAVALRFVKFPLLTLPIGFALWFLSMDITNAVFRVYADTVVGERVSLVFGVAMLAVSIYIDRRGERSYAFWTYLNGTLSVYVGLALLWTDEFHEAVFAAICVLFVALSIVLQRRVLVIFAAFGIAAYLGHLAYDVFHESVIFPFALTLVGLAIVAGGILYQRNEGAIRRALLSMLPAGAGPAGP